jgi:hypothetical protein
LLDAVIEGTWRVSWRSMKILLFFYFHLALPRWIWGKHFLSQRSIIPILETWIETLKKKNLFIATLLHCILAQCPVLLLEKQSRMTTSYLIYL